MGTKKTRRRGPVPVTAKYLIRFRKQFDLSRQELADFLGVTHHAISSWETERRTPQPYLRLALDQIALHEEVLPEA